MSHNQLLDFEIGCLSKLTLSLRCQVMARVLNHCRMWKHPNKTKLALAMGHWWWWSRLIVVWFPRGRAFYGFLQARAEAPVQKMAGATLTNLHGSLATTCKRWWCFSNCNMETSHSFKAFAICVVTSLLTRVFSMTKGSHSHFITSTPSC